MNLLFVPESVRAFKAGYSLRMFVNDLMAGVTVGIVALPLAIAFAIASGVKPEQGIYTAVTAGFIVSLFSGSRVQIGGPTGAFIIVVYGIVARFGYDGLMLATMMAGVLLVLMGITRLGGAIRFIPYPMTVGFTAGIALIIFTTQVRDFMGLDMAEVPADFIHKCIAFAERLHTLDPATLSVGLLSLGIMLLWPKLTRKIPGSVVAILVVTALVAFFEIPVETIGSRFGSVPSAFPQPRLPAISFDLVRRVSPAAFTIAMLAAIESLLSAVVADGITGDRHDSNMELVAQGLANLVAPVFGGIPATGAIARTATNIKSGAQSPVAGVIHAVTLLLIMICLAPWAELIPMATLAAILMVVAFHMSEWRFFIKLFRSPRSDVFVLLTTFGLTLFFDLSLAIELGVVLSALLFMNRMANTTVIRRTTPQGEKDPHALSDRQVPGEVEVFEIHGPFFFGAANRFKDTIRVVGRKPKVLILRCRHILFIDATALHALEELVEKSHRDNTVIILSGVHTQPLVTLEQSGLYYTIGEDNIFGNIDEALNRAREVVGLPRVSPAIPFVPTVSRETSTA